MSNTVKIFNLTDSGSPVLAQHALNNRHLAVCDLLLGPGESGNLATEKWDSMKNSYARLITLGAISVDQPPAQYLAAKANSSTGALKAPEKKKTQPPPSAE